MHPGNLESDPKRRMFPAYRFYAEPIMLRSVNLVAILLHQHKSIFVSYGDLTPRQMLMCYNSQENKTYIVFLARMDRKISAQSSPILAGQSTILLGVSGVH
jgi:hypothetical protein